MRGLGKGVKSFKDSERGKEEINKAKTKSTHRQIQLRNNKQWQKWPSGIIWMSCVGYFFVLSESGLYWQSLFRSDALFLFDHVILAPAIMILYFTTYTLYRSEIDWTDEFLRRPFKVKLVNINLAAPFFIHMSTAFWMSVVTTMPIFSLRSGVLSTLALYPNERKESGKPWP